MGLYIVVEIWKYFKSRSDRMFFWVIYGVKKKERGFDDDFKILV